MSLNFLLDSVESRRYLNVSLVEIDAALDVRQTMQLNLHCALLQMIFIKQQKNKKGCK